MKYLSNYESKNQINVNKAFKLMADVGEVGRIESFIDTGSDGCWIRKECLPPTVLSNKMIHPSKTARQGFDGSTETILGDVFLDITILGRTVQVRVHVMSTVVSAKLCLGIDWIRKMGIVLRPNGSRYYITLKGGKRERADQLSCCSLPIFRMNVDGISEQVNTLVDTGSPVSMVCVSILTETILSTMFQAPKKLRSSNGEDTNSLGCVSLVVTHLGAATREKRKCNQYV